MKPLRHSNNNANSEISDLLFQVFSTPEGRKALALFRERTIERPITPQAGYDGIGIAISMGEREGENRFVRWIESNVKKGETGQ